jgi:hypothetical protein
MIKYLTTFQTEAAYNTFLASNDCPYINISHIVATDENKYYKESSVLQNTPFTITVDHLTSGNTIGLTFQVNKTNGSTIQTYCKYKINNGTWQTYYYNLTPNDDFVQIPNVDIEEGDVIQIINKSNICRNFFIYQNDGEISCTVSGNIMSIVWGDDYVYAPACKVPYPNTTHSDYRHNGYEILHFSDIIYDHKLTDAGDLWLPTKNLGIYIFDSMFNECSNLIDAPDINAKYLPKGACKNMFKSCSSLTTMPTILAETLEESAMDYMFGDCSSLVTTTQLHIKKIIVGGMNWIFSNCTSLVTAPIWNEDIEVVDLTNNYNWFDFTFAGCSSLEDVSTWNLRFNSISAYNSQTGHCMFAGCTSVENSPLWGLTYESSDEITLETMYEEPWGGSISAVDTIYLLMTKGKINGGSHWEALTQGGTVYVQSGSEYLSGGSLSGTTPCNLQGWTVAEYVPANN